MKDKKQNWTLEVLTTVLLIAAAIMAMNPELTLGQLGPSSNARNFTVQSLVNITNSFPEVISVLIDPSPITLNAGTTVLVVVNVSVRDYDGFGDITLVNATFFDSKVATHDSVDDFNDHYTNSTCGFVAGSGVVGNYTCHFNVEYYANNGTNWTANITVIDTQNFSGTGLNQTTVNSLLAVNVTSVIDFGNMAVGDTSVSTISANVTNFGNVPINLSLYGYGVTPNDGLAMICTFRNITIDNERFSTNDTAAYASMTSLTSSNQVVNNFNISQRTNDTAGGETRNSTYWRLLVPIAQNPAGNCSGFIVFQAESP